MNKSKTVAFTGHRSVTGISREELSRRLDEAIMECYNQGYRRFITGMAMGFDMLAAEAVVRLRAAHPDIHLEAAIPFPGQPERFSYEDKRRYAHLLRAADSQQMLSSFYHSGCFHRRNDYMIDNASKLIACWDGKPSGGTYYTYTEAQRRGLSMVNLLEQK